MKRGKGVRTRFLVNQEHKTPTTLNMKYQGEVIAKTEGKCFFSYQWIRLTVIDLCTQELNNGRKFVGSCDGIDVLLHDRYTSNGSKVHNNL